MFYIAKLRSNIRVLNYLITFLLIYQGSVETASIIVNTIEDVKLPAFFGCGAGYQKFKNFSCLDVDPAIPIGDQDFSRWEGFWSACNPSRTCEFSYFKQKDVYVNSITFIAYFVGDSKIDIEIPGNGIPIQTLTGTADSWNELKLDLTMLGDYPYFATIKIRPSFNYFNSSVKQFVIIDMMGFNTDEPTTTTLRTTTTKAPTTTIPTTTPTTPPTTTIPTTTSTTTLTTSPSTTTTEITEPSTTTTSNYPDETTTDTTTAPTLPPTTTTRLTSPRPVTRKTTTTETTTYPESEEPVSTTPFEVTTDPSKPQKSFWRLSNPIIIVFLTILLISASIVTGCIVVYFTKRRRHEDDEGLPEEDIEDDAYDIGESNYNSTLPPFGLAAAPLPLAFLPKSERIETTSIPYNFQRPEPGDYPVRDRSRRGAKAGSSKPYRASSFPKTRPNNKTVFSGAQSEQGYDGVGLYLPRLTKRGNEG